MKRRVFIKEKLSDEMKAWIRAMAVAVATEIKNHPEDWPVRINVLKRI